jgi:hypothetical protein
VAVSHGVDSDWRVGVEGARFFIPHDYMNFEISFSYGLPSKIQIAHDLKKLSDFESSIRFFVKNSQIIPPNFFYSLMSGDISTSLVSYRKSDQYIVGQLARELIVSVCPPNNTNKQIRTERSQWIIRKIIEELIRVFEYIEWKNNGSNNNHIFFRIPESLIYTRLENAFMIYMYFVDNFDMHIHPAYQRFIPHHGKLQTYKLYIDSVISIEGKRLEKKSGCNEPKKVLLDSAEAMMLRDECVIGNNEEDNTGFIKLVLTERETVQAIRWGVARYFGMASHRQIYLGCSRNDYSLPLTYGEELLTYHFYLGPTANGLNFNGKLLVKPFIGGVPVDSENRYYINTPDLKIKKFSLNFSYHPLIMMKPFLPLLIHLQTTLYRRNGIYECKLSKYLSDLNANFNIPANIRSEGHIPNRLEALLSDIVRLLPTSDFIKFSVLFAKSISSADEEEKKLVEEIDANIKKEEIDFLKVNKIKIDDNTDILYKALREVQTDWNFLYGIDGVEDRKSRGTSSLYFPNLFQYTLETVYEIAKKTERFGKDCDSGINYLFNII